MSYTTEWLYRLKKVRDLLLNAGKVGISATNLIKAIDLHKLKCPQKALQRVFAELKIYECDISRKSPNRQTKYILESKGSLSNLDTLVATDDERTQHIKEIVGLEKLQSLCKQGVIQIHQGLYFIQLEPSASLILQAIEQQQVIVFDYQKLTDQTPIRRVVVPYIIKEVRSEWYLIGAELAKDTEDWGLELGWLKFYNLSKMQNTDSFGSDEFPYIENKEIYATDRFKHCYGAFINEEEGSVEDVILAFAPQFAKHFKQKPFHPTQEILKSELYEFRLKLQLHVGHYGTDVHEYNQTLLQDLASYGRQVKVIAPLHLAEALKNYLHEALNHYV